MKPTLDQVRALLSYDPMTGIFHWKVSRSRYRAGDRAGIAMRDGYRRIGFCGKTYPETHLAWLLYYGEWPIAMIDHRDRVRDHNWIANLRQASARQNQQNGGGGHKNSSSRFRGVSWRRQKWEAAIRVNGRTWHLGAFDCETEAAKEYDKFARQHYGEFACLNFGDCHA